jgi:predicted metal-dependent phosphoesterase TrpH
VSRQRALPRVVQFEWKLVLAGAGPGLQIRREAPGRRLRWVRLPLASAGCLPRREAPPHNRPLIDLHAHTTASDGALTPAELIAAALELGLEALAITDHDTLAGYEQAKPLAEEEGLELVCAVEVSARFRRPAMPRSRGAHLLGYFLGQPPGDEFRRWLEGFEQRRAERNQRLAARLRDLGLQVTLQEAAAHGRRLTGRVHFAQVLVSKGYAGSIAEAFRLYLGESGRAYVPLERVELAEAIGKVRAAGGLPSLAHPGRLKHDLEPGLGELCAQGLSGLEAYSSEHSPAETALFLDLARRYDLVVTGGSDFHGETKPGVRLGSGLNGNLAVPREVLEGMRRRAQQLSLAG